jgi:serine/threonine protein kinase
MFEADQIIKDKYQFKQQLGRTAAGRKTWLALDLETGEKVVIKLLAFSPEMRWEELKLFEREAEVLRVLDHPQIPKYRDYFDVEKDVINSLPWFALVQNYIPGASLQEILDQGKTVTEKQAKNIASQVLQILSYLHELEPAVLHRDIKPGNLILGEDQKIYLVDFGAVQSQATVTGVTFTVVGTSGYAPLEQFWGRAVPSSDLYALGATLIHLLTGIAPADLPQKNARIHFRDQVNISEHFANWIEKITDNLDNRFPDTKTALFSLKNENLMTVKKRSEKLKKLSKPAGSLIKIQKLSETLQVETPSPGFRILLMNQSFFGVLFALYLVLVLVSFFSFFVSAIFIVGLDISYKFLVLLIFAIVVIVFASLFSEKHYLTLTHQKSFEINKQFLGRIVARDKCNLSDIINVFLNKEKGHYSLKFYTNKKKYTLGPALGEDEAAWLAQEIQDWLRDDFYR